MVVDEPQPQRASSELGEFIVHAAATTQELVGFAWIGRPDAPSTYPDLLRAVQRSLVTGESLPVSNENSDSVIYAFPEINLSLRFWHDVMHVLRGLDFTPAKELQLAGLHLRSLESAGITPESLPWRLLQADMVGQVYLSAVGKRFPVDQLRFVQVALSESIDAAVLGEIGNAGQRPLSGGFSAQRGRCPRHRPRSSGAHPRRPDSARGLRDLRQPVHRHGRQPVRLRQDLAVAARQQ